MLQLLQTYFNDVLNTETLYIPEHALNIPPVDKAGEYMVYIIICPHFELRNPNLVSGSFELDVEF